jgi:SAM-dependent methyltransferase
MINKIDNLCPLCKNKGELFFQSRTKKIIFYRCNNCLGLFLSKELILSNEDEFKRYKKHNNDINDIKYQNFVNPILDFTFNNFNKENKGLDFGSGSGPVISKLLMDKEYNIKQYDPYFSNNPKLLDKKYDYIICCEVIEHFNNPYKEFKLLKELLNPKGMIICMTNIYNEEIVFKDWNYKNDKTHIFIYQKETLNFIKEKYGFNDILIKDRLIVFYN